MSHTVQMGVENFNNKYEKGYDLLQSNSKLEMISSLFKNTTVTPFYMNEFLYMGTHYYSDFFTENEPVQVY